MNKKKKRVRMTLKGGWVNNIHENQTMTIKVKLINYFTIGYKKNPYFKLTHYDNNKDIYNINDWTIIINENDVTLNRKLLNDNGENKIVFKFDDKDIDLTISDGKDFNHSDWAKLDDFDFSNWPSKNDNSVASHDTKTKLDGWGDNFTWDNVQSETNNKQQIDNSNTYIQDNDNAIIKEEEEENAAADDVTINPLHNKINNIISEKNGGAHRRRTKKRRNSKKKHININNKRRKTKRRH
jgi:hypothetical protein